MNTHKDKGEEKIPNNRCHNCLVSEGYKNVPREKCECSCHKKKDFNWNNDNDYFEFKSPEDCQKAMAWFMCEMNRVFKKGYQKGYRTGKLYFLSKHELIKLI